MAMILGIGNTLLKDEGIGIHLLNYIEEQNPQWQSCDKIEMIDGGTLSFDLLASIQADQDLIVLDAINLNQSPGTVYCLQDQAMDEFLSQPGKSVHEVSLQDLFDMSR
ncbi:MAG: hydrogenase maturation protease, partial [Gammaproteobacteria bacterium]|nr:hydrogenase maturation protease [Gammaproteobacteria bacterium]